MKNWLRKKVDIEIWKDLFDEQWRVQVIIFGKRIARFKITPYTYESFSGTQHSYKVDRELSIKKI